MWLFGVTVTSGCTYHPSTMRLIKILDLLIVGHFAVCSLRAPSLGAQLPMAETWSDGFSNFIGALTIAGSFVIPEVSLHAMQQRVRVFVPMQIFHSLSSSR